MNAVACDAGLESRVGDVHGVTGVGSEEDRGALGSRSDWLSNVLGDEVFGVKLQNYVSLVDGVSKPVVRLPSVPVNASAGALARFFGAASGVALRQAYTTLDSPLSSSGSSAGATSEFAGSVLSKAAGDVIGEATEDRPFDVPGPAGKLLGVMNDMVLARTGVVPGSQIASGCCYEVVFKPQFRHEAVANLRRWPTLRALLDVPFSWFLDSDDLQRVGVSVRGGNLHFQVGWGDGVLTALDVVTVGLRSRLGTADGVDELLSMKVGGPPASQALPDFPVDFGVVSMAGTAHDMKAKAWIGDAMHQLDVRTILLEHHAYADAVRLMDGYTSASGQSRFLHETGRKFADTKEASDWFESNYGRIHSEYRSWLRVTLRDNLLGSRVAQTRDADGFLLSKESSSIISGSGHESGSTSLEAVSTSSVSSKLDVLVALIVANDRVGFLDFLRERCNVREFYLLEQCVDRLMVDVSCGDVELACRPSKSGPLEVEVFKALVTDWFADGCVLSDSVVKLVRGRSVGNVGKKDAVKCVREVT